MDRDARLKAILEGREVGSTCWGCNGSGRILGSVQGTPPLCVKCNGTGRIRTQPQGEVEEAAARLFTEHMALREMALGKHDDTDKRMREILGQRLWNMLWGPELEKLGDLVDVAFNMRDALQAQLAERDAQVAEWARVCGQMHMERDEARARLAEARDEDVRVREAVGDTAADSRPTHQRVAARIDSMRTCWDRSSHRIMELEAQLARVREYAEHNEDCTGQVDAEGRRCTCGLAEALAGGGK